mgnify:CR=1 FL=1
MERVMAKEVELPQMKFYCGLEEADDLAHHKSHRPRMPDITTIDPDVADALLDGTMNLDDAASRANSPVSRKVRGPGLFEGLFDRSYDQKVVALVQCHVDIMRKELREFKPRALDKLSLLSDRSPADAQSMMMRQCSLQSFFCDLHRKMGPTMAEEDRPRQYGDFDKVGGLFALNCCLP